MRDTPHEPAQTAQAREKHKLWLCGRRNVHWAIGLFYQRENFTESQSSLSLDMKRHEIDNKAKCKGTWSARKTRANLIISTSISCIELSLNDKCLIFASYFCESSRKLKKGCYSFMSYLVSPLFVVRVLVVSWEWFSLYLRPLRE